MQTITTIRAGRLLVGSYAGFAPVCWRDGDLARGRDLDLLRAFADEHGLQMVVEFFPFDRLWELPGRDGCDIAAAGIAPLPERATAGVDWSEPYFTVQRSLLIRAADRLCLHTIADFEGRTIAVTRGSTADHDVCRRKPTTTRVVYYNDQACAVRDLLAGTIDAFAEGDLCSAYLMSHDPVRLAITDVHPMEPAETFTFAVRAASGLLDPLNRFIGAWCDHYARGGPA